MCWAGHTRLQGLSPVVTWGGAFNFQTPAQVKGGSRLHSHQYHRNWDGHHIPGQELAFWPPLWTTQGHH